MPATAESAPRAASCGIDDHWFAALKSDPSDRAGPSVYADCLEEQAMEAGNSQLSDRAEWIRLHTRVSTTPAYLPGGRPNPERSRVVEAACAFRYAKPWCLGAIQPRHPGDLLCGLWNGKPRNPSRYWTACLFECGLLRHAVFGGVSGIAIAHLEDVAAQEPRVTSVSVAYTGIVINEDIWRVFSLFPTAEIEIRVRRRVGAVAESWIFAAVARGLLRASGNRVPVLYGPRWLVSELRQIRGLAWTGEAKYRKSAVG